MGRGSSEISGRFRKLLAEFSQAEMARRCDIPPSNLSRYVNGQRIPAEVCSSLVRHLGVSPLWLLTGEGPMFGAQLEAEDSAATGLRHLLDKLSHRSVRALDAVPRTLRGGSLASLRRDLTQLNDVQRQLHDNVKTLYQELLQDLIEAMDAFEGDRVERVLQQLRDLETVCTDPALIRQRRNFEAVRLLENNRPLEALAIQREIFGEAMASFGDVGKPQLMQEFNFIATLRSCGYFAEARAYARALTELRRPLEEHAEYWLLLVLGAFLEIELGELSAGLEQLSRSLARVPEKYRHENYSLVICAHLLQGTLTLESALASEVSRVEGRPRNERMVSALSLLRFGACVDAVPTLVQIFTGFEDVHDVMTSTEDPCVRFARAVVRVEDDGATAERTLEEIEDELPSDAEPENGGPQDLSVIEHHVLATRFATLYGARRALDLWRESRRRIDALEPTRTPRLLTRWLHARNTLWVDGNAEEAPDLAEPVRAANAFLEEYVGKGYVAFGAATGMPNAGEEVA